MVTEPPRRSGRGRRLGSRPAAARLKRLALPPRRAPAGHQPPGEDRTDQAADGQAADEAFDHRRAYGEPVGTSTPTMATRAIPSQATIEAVKRWKSPIV